VLARSSPDSCLRLGASISLNRARTNCATGSIVIELAVVAECLILLLQDVSERVARDRIVDVLALSSSFCIESVCNDRCYWQWILT
jgi:hypothetical protein